MTKVDENLEALIEKLSSDLLEMDPKDKEYVKLQQRLDALLRHRETQYRNEMDAVENDRRIEFDKEKLETEKVNNKKKSRNDVLKVAGDFAGKIISAGVTAALVVLGYKLEYDDKNPVNIPTKTYGWLKNLKF